MIEIKQYSITKPQERSLVCFFHRREGDKPLLYCIRRTAPLHPPNLYLDFLIAGPHPLVLLNRLQRFLDSSIWLSLLIRRSR